MPQIKKTIYLLLLIACCFLLFPPIQSIASQSEVTLTWSTNTYTPPGYLGKALPARGSIVEVAANIFSRNFNPQELFYDWFFDDDFQKNGSGEGEQVFKFNIGERISQKRTIKVIIKDRRGGNVIGRSSYLTLAPQEPEIVIKTSAPLLNYSKFALNYQVESNKKTIFAAQSYFFNISDTNDLDYQWVLGDKKAIQTDNQNLNIFTLWIDKIETSFEQNLTVRVENKNNPIQRTRLTAEIIFVP